jgi:hypothetical protein
MGATPNDQLQVYVGHFSIQSVDRSTLEKL